MFDDADRLAGDVHRLTDLLGIVLHQDDIRRLDSGVGAERPHRDADVGAGKYRRVVDPVPYEGDAVPCLSMLRQDFLDFFHFIRRQKFAVHLIQSQIAPDLVRRCLRVAGEHDQPLHSGRPQCRQRFAGVGLLHVGDYNVAHILAVDRHMDDRSRPIALMPRGADTFHHLAVAHGDHLAVDPRLNAVPRDLLDIRHVAVVLFLRIGRPQRIGDGMRRIALHMRCQMQEILLADNLRMHRSNFKHASRQRPGLIENHRVNIRQRLEIIRAFHQDAARRSAADSGEKRQRHGDNEGAGAADDKQNERPLDPYRPHRLHAHEKHAHEGDTQGQRDSKGTNRRGVDAGEAGDEILRARLLHAGVFHQIQDLRRRRFVGLLRRADP